MQNDKKTTKTKPAVNYRASSYGQSAAGRSKGTPGRGKSSAGKATNSGYSKRSRNTAVKRHYIDTLIWMVVLVTVFVSTMVLSYKFVYKKFHIDSQYNDAGLTVTPAAGTTVSDSTTQTWLIYVTDEDTIRSLYLGVINSSKVELNIFEIPSDTRITVSNAYYKELIVLEPSVPQIMTMSELYRYFENENAFSVGRTIIEEAILTKIDYYMVLDGGIADEIFNSAAEQKDYGGIIAVNAEATVKEHGGMKRYLQYLNENALTDTDGTGSAAFLETYEGLTNMSVRYKIISGENHNSSYEIDGSAAYGDIVAARAQ